MKLSDIKDVAILGAVAYAIYLLMKKGDDTSKSFAEWWVNFRTGGAVETTGEIRLPDGSFVSTNVMSLPDARRQFVNDTIFFTYKNRRYKIVEHDVDGNWVAVYA